VLNNNIDLKNLASFYLRVKSILKKYADMSVLEIRNDINKIFFEERLPFVVDFILTIMDDVYLVFLIGRSPKDITSEKLESILDIFNKITRTTGIILIWNTPTLESVILKSNLLNKLDVSSIRNEFETEKKDLDYILNELIGKESYQIIRESLDEIRSRDVEDIFINNFKSTIRDYYYGQSPSKDFDAILQKLFSSYPEIEEKLKKIIDKDFNIKKKYRNFLSELIEDIDNESN
jgi:hypothetical protein